MRRPTSALTALIFGVQSIVLPADGRSQPSSLASLEAEPRPTFRDSATALLDRQNPAVAHHGLSISLRNGAVGPVVVRVTCVGRSGTPSLAVDAAAYGAGASLLNLTAGSGHDCASYQVAGASLGTSLISAPLLSRDRANEDLAVGVHYAGIRPDAALAPPSIFVFNPVHGNWTAAAPFAPSAPEPQRAYATLSSSTQQIIAGAIVPPESLQAEPSGGTPASLAAPLENVNPLSGYLGVERIEPDSRGGYTVDLPLLLRPSRGPGPSFAVRYSSQGAPGVLGRGWDLAVSAIEVRGPGPVYHPAFETEDYLLDGMDLIALDAEGRDIPPLYKGGPIIPRMSSMRVFRLRDNSRGLIARRYGDSPGNYFWEVWDPHGHITRLYGGAFNGNDAPPSNSGGNGVLQGLVPFGDGPPRAVVAQWALTAEYDRQPARNGTLYTYAQAAVPGASRCTAHWTDDCTPALRLSEVEYNRTFAGTVPASGLTRVRFSWKPRASDRFNSDGRLGVFRAHEYWLTDIVVHYTPEPRLAWLSAAAGGQPAGEALFSRHRFELGGENNACMNFDRVLTRYTVEANPLYDVLGARAVTASAATDEAALTSQSFGFSYEGQRGRAPGECEAAWPAPAEPQDLGTAWPAPAEPQGLGNLLDTAAAGQLDFPSGLLGRLGYGLRTAGSLLGTGRSEEAGASLYAGAGPAGDTSSREATVGLTAGVNFTRSEGNSTLLDITGDGVDDLVLRAGGALSYCAGRRSRRPEDGVFLVDFPPERCGTVEGVSEFSVSSSRTSSASAEMFGPFASFFGVGFSSSENETYAYFTDRDGDGLVDVVNYGRVLYNQGEVQDGGRNVVRFVPRSALTPPIPGRVRDEAVSARLPPDMRASITTIEARLEATSRALRELEFSQTTLAWEAPLTGNVALSGTLVRGASAPEPANAGPLGADFGPADFEAMPGQIAPYQGYIADRAACRLWGADEQCHATASDPLGAHFVPTPRRISFIETPPAVLKLWLSRRSTRSVVACGEVPLGSTSLDLATLQPGIACRGNAPAGQIRVEAGDVLYLAYNVHPHLSAWVRPEGKVAYTSVDGDAAFNLSLAGNAAADSLPCRWKDEGRAGSGGNCLLARQTRYTYDFRTALLPSSPAAAVLLPPGVGRTFGGLLEIPADLVRDYQVYFDVMGEPRSEWALPPPTAIQTRAPLLPRLFRQDISAQCAASAAGGTCSVEIAPVCDPAASSAGCAAFSTLARPVALASRLTILHRVQGTALPVRNISARLADVRWQVPPHVRSEFVERGVAVQPSATGAARATVVHLPLTMGEPDLEYVQVKDGRFFNPDTTLDDDRRSDEVFFREIMQAEPESVQLARLRQTLALCGFAREIETFVRDRATPFRPPFTEDYGDYWSAKVGRYAERCVQARAQFDAYSFTYPRRPEIPATDTLRLPFFLRELPPAEQITSAETLLERVLATLTLGEDLLTDGPHLTRRGYRLPANVNPFDCGVPQQGEPLTEPVTVARGDCSYRLSLNFAMQSFEDVAAQAASNMREVLAQFQQSRNAAFEIELMLTVNGRPVVFRELSGERTGNDGCAPVTEPNSCLGTYGTRGTDGPQQPIAAHYYPLRQSQDSNAPHGDVLQRITTNKRTGRAVAFSNSVMLTSPEVAYCPRALAYADLAAMEAKQDCRMPNGLPMPDDMKYVGASTYVASYTIGENNQFQGRNRVLEFRARPLDVVEFHVRLAPVASSVTRNPGAQGDVVEGNFSVFDAAASSVGIERSRFLIPRSPSQILTATDTSPESDVSALTCLPIVGGQMPATCRPWTRLGWAEILLGAQYRTYSDAQRSPPGRDRFSILQRREILRLFPEIAVDADRFALVPPGGRYIRIQDVRPEARLAYHAREPNLWKIGGDWALFAGRAPGGVLQPPPHFSAPLDTSLRYGPPPAPAGREYRPEIYANADRACGDPAAPDHDSCGLHFAAPSREILGFRKVAWFPLEHRFVGPVSGPAFDASIADGRHRPETGVCAAEAPTANASCWKGLDDSIFLERAVSPSLARSPATYSVSALVGFERPPIARFLFEFDAYRRIACTDPQSPPGAAGICPAPVGPAMGALPNRPMPPSRAIEIFAPVQSSSSTSVARNDGAAYINRHQIHTHLNAVRQFRDVNGDGFPDVISDDAVELTSPVGLPRRDWWTYFRTSDVGAMGSGGEASDFGQWSRSTNTGAGIGLSPHTAALFQSHGAESTGSGSPDAAVDPSFSYNLARGYDEAFVELRDFNGDGIADRLSGGAVSSGLGVRFGTGNGMGARRAGPASVQGGTLGGYHFNTNHSAGFGVRLGFSSGAGSILSGLGLSHRDTGMQAALIDFTGDGRPDIVVPHPEGLGLLVFPNVGNGFGHGRLHRLADWTLPRPETDSGTESGTGLTEATLVDAGSAFTAGTVVWLVKIVFRPGIKWARSQTRELLSIRDLNGDGVPDVVTVSGESLPVPDPTLGLNAASPVTRVHYNPEGKYHLLAGITNPSGARWALRHGLFGNSGPEHGRSVWALTAAARSDGYAPSQRDGALPPRGHDVRLTTFDYEDGYYNRAERQFYGFAARTSRTYGCSTAGPSAAQCLAVMDGTADVDPAPAGRAGFRRLQVVHQTFSNRDFLTQGLELSRTVAGAASSPTKDAEGSEPALEAVSREVSAYSIEGLGTLTGDFAGRCGMPDRMPLADSWDSSTFSGGQSALGAAWDGSTAYRREQPTLGVGGLCTTLGGCAETLRQKVCEAGFEREQRAFWAQQSGSVRRRLVTLESFGGSVSVAERTLEVNPGVERLHSAVVYDYDLWGQVVGSHSLGEARSDWTPQADASVHSEVGYARRQGLDAVRAPDGVGYPMLGLAENLQVFAGPWGEPNNQAPPLRAREALYSENRREAGGWRAVNLTDVCLYPGGEGFRFAPGICAAFKRNMRDALGDGYSTVQDALRRAFAGTAGLPGDGSSFDAVLHHQLVAYDDLGNLLHAISPMSRNREWIERRFDYAGDPFRRMPTSVALTRCVTEVPGAGADSPAITRMNPSERPRCTLGFEALPDPILRSPITHLSRSRIDGHFGTAAESTDINGNRLLLDVDRWGRLTLVARDWGNAPREHRTLRENIALAIGKDPASERPPANVPIADVDRWRVLAAIDYGRVAPGQHGEGLLRSNVRRFESSDAYGGLLSAGQTTRETAVIADGVGRVVQSIREADVCTAVDSGLIEQGRNRPFGAGLAERCASTATAVVTPGVRSDALGRALEAFEAYPVAGSVARNGSAQRFDALAVPPAAPAPLVSTTYDGAGRPVLVESRLSRPRTPGTVAGATQHRYRVVPEEGDRFARFEALTLSPRCTASAVWSDARGLRRMVFEDQATFFRTGPGVTLGDPPLGQAYRRDHERTREHCAPIETIAEAWTSAARQAATNPGGQPARVSYAYDPVGQLVGVDAPLDGSDRAETAVRYDLLGRMREMQEPNSGCTRYDYDGLNALISETGYRYEGKAETPCGTSSRVRNQKTYDYAGGRLVRMSYHSLEEQGGPRDDRDTVRLFHDRSPWAIVHGTPAEALRFVPNDQANGRFIDAAGRTCDNCIGQVTVVSDRTGARAFAFNELGLARREVRSIVAPLREVHNSAGASETYLPEVGFYELENSYTAFGDPVQERFAEGAPMNPARACIQDGRNTCLARFTIGRRYAPDGAVAQLTFNGRPMVSGAQDALGRAAVRWTANGVATGYRYDPLDLRLNQMVTWTAGRADGSGSRPVQAVGYQYDGGGNILDYANRPLGTAKPDDRYESAFAFEYDPANRLVAFRGAARRGAGSPGDAMESHGRFSFDAGHRFRTRSLTISGGEAESFQRRWTYAYGGDPRQGPLHAPRSVAFAIGDRAPRDLLLSYDDLGRTTRMRTTADRPNLWAPLLSNRAMTWDAEGRLIRVRGVQDGALPLNDRVMREDYAYDSGGNRTLRIHRPWIRDGNGPSEREREFATLYMTPFYARPYDGRGSVQISQGNLPTASLAAPADGSEDPVATYLYTDLPVGSMTAAVTVFGEATDTRAIGIARREYSPFGLELTTDGLASTDRSGAPPLSVFHGKELDHVTNFSSFGARYYARDLGLWMRPDPAYRHYLSGRPNGGVFAVRNANAYGFAGQNPIVASDPSGNVLDTILDVGFIVYDVGVIAHDEIWNGGQNRAENWLALGADAAGVLVPFATGGGLAVRGGIKTADHAAELAVRGGLTTVDNAASGAAHGFGSSTRSIRPDFIVSPDGAVVHTSPARVRESLEGAGFPGRSVRNPSGTETGTVHNVPGMRMDIRVMDGGPNHPARAVTSRQGTSQPVNPANGSNLGNVPRSEQRARSHIVFP